MRKKTANLHGIYYAARRAKTELIIVRIYFSTSDKIARIFGMDFRGDAMHKYRQVKYLYAVH